MVVQQRDNYTNLGPNHLADQDIEQICRALNTLTAKAKTRGEDMAKHLTTVPEKIKTQQPYFPAKLHKAQWSGIEGPTERVSSFRNYYSGVKDSLLHHGEYGHNQPNTLREN